MFPVGGLAGYRNISIPVGKAQEREAELRTGKWVPLTCNWYLPMFTTGTADYLLLGSLGLVPVMCMKTLLLIEEKQIL
jgi:hypothetical protein